MVESNVMFPSAVVTRPSSAVVVDVFVFPANRVSASVLVYTSVLFALSFCKF